MDTVNETFNSKYTENTDYILPSNSQWFSRKIPPPAEECSYPAELVYGTTLCLPGKFFTSDSSNDILDPISYATHLKTFMQQLHPNPVWQQPQRKSYVSTDLSTYVFVRHDGVRRSLQAPYDGPFQVLKRHNKHYTLDISGQSKVVSLDRLKPVYIGNKNSADAVTSSPTTLTTPQSSRLATPQPPQSAAPQSRKTRSGSLVHWLKRLVDYRLLTQ